MRKSKALRVTGFVGALCASAALVGTTVATTGAYFSDSKDGSITATSGHLDLRLNKAEQMAMTFDQLWPGTNQNRPVDYSIDASSDGVDLWLTMDPDSVRYQQFTGGKHSALWDDGGLGRYGFFAVSDTHGGTAFKSGNLAFADGTNNPSMNGCPTDANGRGGSSVQAQTKADFPPYCGVPSQILLASNLAHDATGTVTVTFGLGPIQTQQNQAEFNGRPVTFKLVATQHGQRP